LLSICERKPEEKGVAGKKVVVKRLRIKEPGMTFFNCQKMPVGGAQLGF
jgi:hypothetical protein